MPKRPKRKRRKRPTHAPDALRWVRRIAWALCLVTFPLLWMGGLVTTTKSGMAVPDWPNTYGYNMFLYPWQSWILGPWDLFIEHSHRLWATLAGLLTIALLVLLWRNDQRKWMRNVGIAALVGVIGQGILGGMRVVLDDRTLALAHGCIGPLFFALTVAIVVWTSKNWLAAERLDSAISLRWLSPIALTAILLVFLQLVLGAMLRHQQPTASHQSFVIAVKSHLYLAAVVAAAGLAIMWLARHRVAPRTIRWSGTLTGIVVGIQLALGATTWLAKYGVPTWAEPVVGAPTTAIVADGWWQTHVVTAHQATGSLLLAGVVVTYLLAMRLAPTRVIESNSQPVGNLSAAGATA